MEQLLRIVLEQVRAKPAPTLSSPSSADNAALISHPDPSACPCVHELLKRAPDSVYRFRPGDKDDNAPDRWSFNELVEQWRQASKEQKRDCGSFPDIRKADSAQVQPFTECLLCCAFERCESREERPLTCKPYKFGDKDEEVRRPRAQQH